MTLFALQMGAHVAVIQADTEPKPGRPYTAKCCRQSTSCEANELLVGVKVYVLKRNGYYTAELPEGKKRMPQYEVTTWEEAEEVN